MDSITQALVTGLTILVVHPALLRPSAAQSIEKVTVIRQPMTPKSVGHNGHGLFFVQNMMYRHSIDVYNRAFNLVRRIEDAVILSKFGYKNVSGRYRGSPVEVAFSRDGQWAWVSNYAMQGRGFDHPGVDKCEDDKAYDHSFVYQINTKTFQIKDAIAVGSVPKHLVVTPDDRYLLVSNWCSGTLSVISLRQQQRIKEIRVGKHPRGIAVSPDSSTAYVALMGARRIAEVDLQRETVNRFSSGGSTPRHLQISPSGQYLYVSLSQPGRVTRINLHDREVTGNVRSGAITRGMGLSSDGKYLYAANYRDNSITKIHTRSFRVVERAPTPAKPISITIDQETGYIWVACYSGSLAIYRDHRYPPSAAPARPHSREPPPPNEEPYPPSPPVASDQADETPRYPWLVDHSPDATWQSPEQPETAPHEAPPLDPIHPNDEWATTRSKRPRSSAYYYVIVASFSQQQNANRHAQKLRAQGYQAGVVPSRKRYFRVYAVRTRTKEQAQQQLPQVRSRLTRRAWVYSKRHVH